ncbi:MAG: hypothetical protein KDD44_00325 [Bdellovibrionales bacterium]|nr:hypothetical protein [Bdellovibrionales bacterium]
MLLAIHYGGVSNGEIFRLDMLKGDQIWCRPVSWGPGLHTHKFPVSSFEVYDRTKNLTEQDEAILAAIESSKSRDPIPVTSEEGIDHEAILRRVKNAFIKRPAKIPIAVSELDEWFAEYRSWIEEVHESFGNFE